MSCQGVARADLPQYLGGEYQDSRLNGTLTVPRGVATGGARGVRCRCEV